MGQLNTYTPIYCNERASSMLDTPPQDTLQTFIIMMMIRRLFPVRSRSRWPSSCFDCLFLHHGVWVHLASGQDSCSEEPGRLAVSQLWKWRTGSATRHDRRFVAGYPRREREFAYQIPRFSENHVFTFTSWYIGNMSCTSFYEWKLLNFKNGADHLLTPCRGFVSGHSYKPGDYRCAIQCISPL